MTHDLGSRLLRHIPALFAAEGNVRSGVEISWHHTWSWPHWATLLMLVIAIAWIIAVYVREPHPIGRSLRIALVAMRIVLLGMLLFMMYGWMMHRQRTDRPDLVIGIDVSESMSVQDQFVSEKMQARADRRVERVGLNAATRINLAKSLLIDPDNGWLRSLADRYHVKCFYVGPDAAPQSDDLEIVEPALRQQPANEGASRLGISLLQILQAQRGRPTAAIILLTDGATTSGATLGEAAEFVRRRAVPLYVVGIGNESPPRDALLTDLLTDDVVFVDDIVNFDVTVRASGYASQPATVQLRDSASGRVLSEQRITLSADETAQAVRLTDRPIDEGIVDYTVEILPLDGELNLDNNRVTRRIDVRDSTIRVFILQAYPSYEFRSLKDLLSRAVKSPSNAEKAVELATLLQTADVEHAAQDATARSDVPLTRDELFDFDVVIFGDVNPALLGSSMMENLSQFVTERGGGLVFLGGQKFTPQAYRDTPLATLFPFAIDSARISAPDVPLTQAFQILPTPLGYETPFLQLGSSVTANEGIWSDLDGMYWLLETPGVKPAARILAVASDRVDDGGQPLPAILMHFVGAGKVVAHNVDETYRWSHHVRRQPHYARYWLQLLRYLSRGKLLSGEQEVQIATDRQEYHVGDVMQLSLQPAAGLRGVDAETPVTLMIQHENGTRREITLARDESDTMFSGSVADLQPGGYRIWLVSPQLAPPPAVHTVRVMAPRGELTHLQMNATDLRRAAKTSGGRFYTTHTADRLVRDLPRGRQVPIESLPAIPIWNSSFLAGLFVTVITLEWLLRKRAGMV